MTGAGTGSSTELVSEMTYKDHLKTAMDDLAKDKDVLFCGYNICDAGGAAGGSLKDVPKGQRQEMPLSENLMAGACVGLSLQGYVPVLWLERSDFMACCFDAIVNHLAQISELSEGIHRPACIIRVCVGNSKSPLFTGPVHTQDMGDALKAMVKFPVVKLTHKSLIGSEYQFALNRARKHRISTALFEYKDMHQH